jgi:CHAT domain-containing protein/tetratricopeptide (TPR) repeat protein
MDTISQTELRSYGQRENAYVLTNIVNPEASLYNDIDAVYEAAESACDQAESAFGAGDPIHIDALLNLSLFHLYRTKDHDNSIAALEKARSFLTPETPEYDELLSELLAVKAILDTVSDHPEESLFVVDILIGFVDRPFGLDQQPGSQEKAAEKALEIYRKMVIAGLSSTNPVRGYLVSEIGQPLIQQLAYSGYSKAAAQAVEIQMPLLEKVWGAHSDRTILAKTEANWRENAGAEDIERLQFLVQCSIFLEALVPYKIDLGKIPKELSAAYELFEKGLKKIKKIIEQKYDSLISVITKTAYLFSDVVQSIRENAPKKKPETAELMLFYSNAFLGCIHLTAPGDEKRQYIEDAILFFKEALTIYYRSSFKKTGDIVPVHHRIRVLLAYAYSFRTQGNLEENTEQMLVHTDDVDLTKKDAYLWALNKSTRALAFALKRDTKVFAGARADFSSMEVDYSASLIFIDEALSVFNKEDYPFEWASSVLTAILINGETLSEATSNDAKHIQAANIQAVEPYFTPKSHPSNWVKLQLEKAKLAAANIGSAQDKDPDLPDKPLDILRRAQSFLPAGKFPLEWARLELEKARILSRDHYREATKHYKSSLTLFDQSSPDRRFVILKELGSLLFQHQAFSDAIPFLQQSFEIGLDHVHRSGSMADRRVGVSDMEGVSKRLAWALLETGRLDDALLAFEKGKCILLYDFLNLRSARLDTVNHEDRAQLQRLLGEIKTLESNGYGGMGFIDDMEKLIDARNNLTNLLDEKGIAPQKNTVETLSAIPGRSALVIPLITEHGTALFILTSGITTISDDHIVRLPELTTGTIGEWLSQKETGWFDVYANRNELIAGSQKFEDAVVVMSDEIARTLLSQTLDRLASWNIDELIFVPTSGLQFLPIASGVIDRFPFRAAPSASILSLLSARAAVPEATESRTPLIAAVRHYKDLPELPNAAAEAAAIAKVLSADPILDEHVTVDGIGNATCQASYIHLACHGAQWAEDPNYGRTWEPPIVLHFAGGSGVSFKDILVKWDLSSSKVITTSACDTALVEFGRPWDEFEGLSNIFLQAGARTIVGSLWSVDDESTALFMVRFYETLLQFDGRSSEALRKTQTWLRDSTHASLTREYSDIYKSYADDKTVSGDFRPFEHPYFWAPFFITGI